MAFKYHLLNNKKNILVFTIQNTYKTLKLEALSKKLLYLYRLLANLTIKFIVIFILHGTTHFLVQ